MQTQISTWRRVLGAAFLVPLAGMVSCAAATNAAGAGSETPGQPAKASGAQVQAFSNAGAPTGVAAVDFELDSLEGDTFRLSEEGEGKVILIDFWATFCDPCLAAMPKLNALHEKYGPQGFAVWAVSIDGPESVAQVRTIAHKQNLKFPVLLDEESGVVALYNPKSSAPYSVLVGRDGNIKLQKEGYNKASAAALEAAIQAELAQ